MEVADIRIGGKKPLTGMPFKQRTDKGKPITFLVTFAKTPPNFEISEACMVRTASGDHSWGFGLPLPTKWAHRLPEPGWAAKPVPIEKLQEKVPYDFLFPTRRPSKLTLQRAEVAWLPDDWAKSLPGGMVLKLVFKDVAGRRLDLYQVPANAVSKDRHITFLQRGGLFAYDLPFPYGEGGDGEINGIGWIAYGEAHLEGLDSTLVPISKWSEE